MKFLKIILIGLILSSNICFAADEIEISLGTDYIISADKIVSTTFVADESIVTLTPFFTIFNEKNVLLLHPQKVGKTSFTIFIGNDDNIFNVTVTPKKAQVENKIIQIGDFEIMLLDAPPVIKELDKK